MNYLEKLEYVAIRACIFDFFKTFNLFYKKLQLSSVEIRVPALIWKKITAVVAFKLIHSHQFQSNYMNVFFIKIDRNSKKLFKM